MLRILTETLANLSAIVTIVSYIVTEKRIRDDRKRKREKAYHQQLEQAKEKGAQLPARSERPRR